MKRQSAEATLLQNTTMIIWDEAPMAPKTSLESVNHLLQDIMQNTVPFGGKIVVLGGDFRQILPIVERGSRVDIVNACLKKSVLWPHFHSFTLRKNMRVNETDGAFQEWLLKLGDGELGEDIIVPAEMRCTGDLIETIFGDAWTEQCPIELAEYCILTPKNAESLKINNHILEKLPG